MERGLFQWLSVQRHKGPGVSISVRAVRGLKVFLMARPLWAVYHVINRGTARQATFLQEQDYEAFLKTLTEAHGLWGIEVFAYCLMSNHYGESLATDYRIQSASFVGGCPLPKADGSRKVLF
jgi:hypothetical protein